MRRRVPPAVAALELTERRLAWGVTADGVALVATPSALQVGAQLLAWTQIERVSWQPPTLSILEVAEVEGAGTRHAWTIEQEHRLAEVVRTQVTSSVGWSDIRRLQPAGKVRVVGRRVPGEDALLWQLVFVEGTDAGDPRLREQAEAHVAALRASLG